MSIHKLKLFLSDNHQDIMEYWTYKSAVKFIRCIHQETGTLCMIKVGSFDIVMDSTTKQQSKVYELQRVLDESEEYSKNLMLLYDTFVKIFPQWKNNFLLQDSNYLMENKESIYKIYNFPFDSYRTIHWMIDLEWFYENLSMLSHEMNKFHLSVNKKTIDIYKQFLNMFESFLKSPEKDVHIVNNIWKYYLEQNNNLNKVSSLYRNVSKLETQLRSQYIQLEETYTSFHFQDSLRKSHRKKMLRNKLHQVLDFKRNVTQKINFYWNKSYNILLEFLLFLSEMTIVLSRFHALFTDLENLLPPPNFLQK